MNELKEEHIRTIYETKSMMKEIHTALVGDKELGHEGLVSQVKENRKDIDEIKTGVKRFKWTVLGIGFGAGVGGAKLTPIILKIISLFGM